MNCDMHFTNDWRSFYLFRSRWALRSTIYAALFVSLMIYIFVLRDMPIQQELQPLDANQNNKIENSHDNLQPMPQISQPVRQIFILYWTKFFETNDFEVGLGRKPFTACGYLLETSCLTTTDRGLLNDSDAVIFHARDLHENDLPPPAWRRAYQIFIFFLMESPVHTDLDMLSKPIFKNYFNRTMTYRRDSDFVELFAYGRLRCIDPSPTCMEFPREADDSAIDLSIDGISGISLANMSVARSKNRTVAWFVSNCNSNSKRESLVKKLSKFIAVDIYGRCGNGNHSCPNKFECDQMLRRHYRFYLSFENSLCPDYVTEKLYRPLAHDTVPVVYGGSDYSVYLPPGSYINAKDYRSPEDLANYLNKLMNDDKLYLSYFYWKVKYVVNPAPLDGWCHMCRLLRLNKKEIMSYVDMAAWWSGETTNKTCSSPPDSLIV